MATILNPRESGKFIAENSKHVSINRSEIDKAALKLKEVMKANKYSCKQWKQWPLHPKLLNENTVHWILTVDTLNFSFWLPRNEKQFQVEYKGKHYEDYEALCACVNRAIEENIPVTTPSYVKNISLDTVRHVFRSSNNTELPLIEERMMNLRQVGTILCDRFNSSFIKVIEASTNDVKRLIKLVTENFPCFNDDGIFDGQQVQFHKRVQILIADLWACFECKSYGEFPNIDELTMFPDYRVPQALLSLNVISYTEDFMNRVRAEELLPHGEREEMEIRGCSIHAIDLIRASLNKMLHEEGADELLNSVLIDFYLWDFATQNTESVASYPEHRTRSIYY